MPTENDTSNSLANPDHARRIAAILSIQPGDSQSLTQFSAEQRGAYKWAIRWIHDFNLGRTTKPNFSDEVLGRLSGFHETQMSEHLHRRQATAPTPPGVLANRQSLLAGTRRMAEDPEAEWNQRILQGLKRMDEDPEYRASIEKRLS